MTKDEAAKYDHIPTPEVLQDIADTEREIEVLESEAEGYEKIAIHGDRMADFKAAARREGVKRRRAFVGMLNEILAARGER